MNATRLRQALRDQLQQVNLLHCSAPNESHPDLQKVLAAASPSRKLNESQHIPSPATQPPKETPHVQG